MKLKNCVVISSIFASVIHAIVIQSNFTEDGALSPNISSKICPNYQLKCPDCPSGYQCAYPDSRGCEGAGIPVCQAIDCHGLLCLTRALPCPDECPFSCRYKGPACCPFLGEPVCEPACQTFAPCQVTTCPEECPGDCFYPEADFCCPNAGKAVCNRDKWTLSTSAIFDNFPSSLIPHPPSATHKDHAYGYKSGGPPEVQNLYNDHNEWADNYPTVEPKRALYHNLIPIPPANLYEPPYYDKNYGNKQGHYGEYSPHEHEHENGYEHEHEHYHHQHEAGDSKSCPVCTKTVTDAVSIHVNFVTTTRSSGPVVCAQYIIPCPADCPNNCIYPTHLPCPFTHQPWCPSVVDQPYESCEYIYNTEGYPIPYFPTYDPFHSVFMSILNNSGVTSTPSYVTTQPTTNPSVICPLIFRYCPPECPDTCVRKNVPCPFAEEGYCPSVVSSATVTTSSLIDSWTLATTSKPVTCPLYINACPYCPRGFSCTRDMIGDCPNTNVPYCVVSSTATQTQAPSGIIYEYYPEMTSFLDEYKYKDEFDYALHAMALSKSETASMSIESANKGSTDVCAKAGLTRIDNKLIFDNILEQQPDCQGCPSVKFDEACDNTCVYFVEGSCCLQMQCLANLK